MTDYDWNKFTLRVSIRAAAEDIRSAWTTRDGIENWFLSSAGFTKPDGALRDPGSRVEPGDTYVWRWHGYSNYIGTGEVLPPEGDAFMRFTFSGGSIVSVTMKHEAGEILCELTQQMPQEKEEDRRYYYIECGKGWTFYLANLKSVLEGGIDLRNKNNDLHEVINA